MNIISNNCIVGKIYSLLNIPYQTPFVWNSIYLSDFVKLMNNYEELIKNDNIKDISLYFGSENFGRTPKCPYLRLHNLVNIYFTHHIQEEMYDKPMKIGSELYYNDILKYLQEKWLKRCNLINLNEEPCFIYDDMNIAPSWKYTDIDVTVLLDENIKYKRLIISANDNLKKYENDKVMFMKKDSGVVDTTILSKNILHNVEIKKFLNIFI